MPARSIAGPAVFLVLDELALPADAAPMLAGAHPSELPSDPRRARQGPITVAAHSAAAAPQPATQWACEFSGAGAR